ncbi:MAG: hypothetical protein QF436_01605 [Candidatus Woesearchaeota archaeon]|jgi:hypothetical protein|nr:hypothetical protein [Candidatus Woesearchaeota archaeon]MDP7622788.1 hypothetical protein [Candidatus Woesearchaeota archaeon]HJN56479.1 hypothetical protein [Candidatus Woesearchaeota archaeon]|tara:strand:- start:21027 stop:21941 length:915 start_codon:yes stop_codon:yes gene_type:complete
MRVVIGKRHLARCTKLAKEANAAVKKALKVQNTKYEKDLLKKDISVEAKKKALTKNLHELIITTFSISPDIKKNSIKNLKANITIIRKTIHKIKSINNYIEEALLKELNIIKSSSVIKAIKTKNPEKYLEKTSRIITKNHISGIEHTIYKLMQEIIFFDKKLLKNYRQKSIKIIDKEKVDVKDIQNILKTESELLDALEAKIPPAKNLKSKLFKKQAFNKWLPLVFALTAAFDTEYEKEKFIFSKFKKNTVLRKKIENKINSIIVEKEKILKIKEKRAVEMKNFGKISDELRYRFHEYIYAASL